MLRERLLDIYDRLLLFYGPQHWWPADDAFEMAVGAILTQSTAWANVEKAIRAMKDRGLVRPAAVHDIEVDELSEIIRSSGYHRVKAQKVKAFAEHLFRHHGGDLESLFHVKLPDLRAELLSVWGIGPETADSIILYGALQPIFVVDEYTRRIFARLGIAPANAGYAQIQALFMDHLRPSVELFQEYHALLVAHGKDTCRPRAPLCARCPLATICPASALGLGTGLESKGASDEARPQAESAETARL